MDELDVMVSVGTGVTPPADPARVEAAVRHVLLAEGVHAAEISVALVGDDEIAALNEQYLSHEGPTGVISFHLHDEGEPPLARCRFPQPAVQALQVSLPLQEVHGSSREWQERTGRYSLFSPSSFQGSGAWLIGTREERWRRSSSSASTIKNRSGVH